MNMPSPRVHRPKTFKQDNNSLFYSPKLCLYMLALCITLLLLLQLQSLQQWQTLVFKYRVLASPRNCNTTQDPESISQKLRDSVTFLPLKDLRFANQPLDGHTWFMSSMYDTREEGEVQYQQFPSKSSKGRLLCLKGRDNHDGSWNYYALAWPEALPSNATLMKGLTFVAYNHYNFDNIWHGLSAVMPFVAWHRKNNCETPTRWVLYHWGELRFKMGTWLNTLVEATFGQPSYIEGFRDMEDEGQPVCFEKAVVMRHNEGGMSRERRMEVYDLIGARLGFTVMNETAVIRIFEKECNKVKGCRLMVAYSNNLTVCEQVKLMSLTDILVSPHGAQLTNMFLMDRNSSVMELYPKGWLKLAGVGQYVFHWIASWSGMRHRGDWRDPDGEYCPYSDDDRRCMAFYKNGLIGYNETHFADWARNVLSDVKTKKSEEEASKRGSASCYCS
ncbi:putative ribonuclease H protein [Hibiscus syriacus]|uniref:Ribonuclease H protein n=1 Tax=Hibiscus syriacus TaxID=106335 RepID=A0A6A3BTL2_HIBSY|nr:putative ribonuclease H protein [Hibiscus syriacus]